MKLMIESFVNLVYFSVIIYHGMAFIKNGIFTICKTKSQRALQSLYFVSILFLGFHQLKLLKIVYKQRVWELDGTLIGSKLKTLQFLGENLLNSVIIFSLALILESFNNFNVKEMKDRQALKISSIIYGVLRLGLITYLTSNVYTNVALYSFLIEMFMISEFLILIFTFISLNETIKKLKIEIEVCLMNDKSYILHILSMIRSFSTKFIFALFFQCVYRSLYLTILINKTSKTLIIIKDISNLLKIISFHFIFENINNLMIFNDPSAVAKCGQQEDDKFFVFEEDQNKADLN
jgi:hypothetical protein